jgi:hypothetical protein
VRVLFIASMVVGGIGFVTMLVYVLRRSASSGPTDGGRPGLTEAVCGLGGRMGIAATGAATATESTGPEGGRSSFLFAGARAR